MRCLLDEVFGSENFISLIVYGKTAGQTSDFLPGTADYIIWYSKDRTQAKYRSCTRSESWAAKELTSMTRWRCRTGVESR
ncbi:MAG: hypothetical protein ACRDS9_13200 [Pseudonocardiaceae bacterium]